MQQCEAYMVVYTHWQIQTRCVVCQDHSRTGRRSCLPSLSFKRFYHEPLLSTEPRTSCNMCPIQNAKYNLNVTIQLGVADVSAHGQSVCAHLKDSRLRASHSGELNLSSSSRLHSTLVVALVYFTHAATTVAKTVHPPTLNSTYTNASHSGTPQCFLM
jgi:hypothetical protein